MGARARQSGQRDIREDAGARVLRAASKQAMGRKEFIKRVSNAAPGSKLIRFDNRVLTMNQF